MTQLGEVALFAILMRDEWKRRAGEGADKAGHYYKWLCTQRNYHTKGCAYRKAVSMIERLP